MANKISRRRFLKRAGGSVLGLGLTAIGGSAWITKIEPDLVEITLVTIPLPNLPASFDGMTLVQVSDWHLGQWMTLDRMLAIARQANALQPDILVMTGDFLSIFLSTTYNDITQSIGAFTAREAGLAVLRNHDHLTNAARGTEAVGEASNCKHLLKEHIVFTRGKYRLYIAGVGYIWE